MYFLISVIVGVTNVIPFFGPFIGAVQVHFDPSGGSYEVPVFSDLHSGTPTV